MLGKNKSACFAVLSIVLVLAAGLAVSGCGGGGFAPKPGKVYKVTFEASGGEPVPETQLVEAGSKIELPKTMERTKFTFSGWYKDPDCKEPWDFARDTVEGDIILFANWKSAAGNSGGGGGGSSGGGRGSLGGVGGGNPGGGMVPSGGGPSSNAITVIFYLNDFVGSPIIYDTKSVTPPSTSISMPPKPTNGALPFFGWNTQANGSGDPFTSKTAVTGSITEVYAMWAPQQTSDNRDGSDKQRAFLVSTPDALKEVGKGNYGWDLDKYYEMNDDIDMGGYEFIPIGLNLGPFMGVFDGNGHKIKNFQINNTIDSKEGVFSQVGDGVCDPDLCKVTGVTLEDCVINCGATVAGMVGYNLGTVEFCNVIGCTINGNGIVGGVVGMNRAKVQNCFTDNSSVKGEGNVGGVVGQNLIIGTVQNCYATGDVTATVNGGGGVVGYNAGGTVQNCYATGSVDAVTYAGGVVGDNSGTVKNCVALNASVTGGSNIGRVAGQISVGATLAKNYANVASGGPWSLPLNDTSKNGANITSMDLESSSWWKTSTYWDTAAGATAWDPTIWDFSGVDTGGYPVLWPRPTP